MPPCEKVRTGKRLIANYHCTVLEFEQLPNNVQALYKHCTSIVQALYMLLQASASRSRNAVRRRVPDYIHREVRQEVGENENKMSANYLNRPKAGLKRLKSAN